MWGGTNSEFYLWKNTSMNFRKERKYYHQWDHDQSQRAGVVTVALYIVLLLKQPSEKTVVKWEVGFPCELATTTDFITIIIIFSAVLMYS